MSITPFVFTYDDSLSGKQKQWILDALGATRFALNRGGAAVNFQIVTEPSCPGHKDYMCTSGTVGDTWQVEIRQGADDPTSPAVSGLPNPALDVKNFFMEGILHEIGHVFFFEHFSGDDAKSTLASFFTYKNVTGEGARTGTLDDWNPPDKPWEDRVQEGLAEFFKDVYMPDQFRVYDNRSNWDFDHSHFGAWVDMIESIICAEIGDT